MTVAFMRTRLEAIVEKMKGVSPSVPILLFGANLFLVFSRLTIGLSEINPWDEAVFINSGRALVDQGAFPQFAGNPLVYIFYAITYLPFKNTALWMVYSNTLARILLFSLLWLTLYLITDELRPHANSNIALGILFVAPLSLGFIRFPTDPLFASLAGLSFWKVLSFRRSGDNKHIWLASLFLGLAALARNDGLILFPIFVFLSFLLALPLKAWTRTIIASVLPFVSLVIGYVLLYGFATGNFSPGTLERTYDNFEAGHQSVLKPSGEINSVIEAKLEARKVFGTAEENDNSVFKAISRNPAVYLQRLIGTVQGLPRSILHAYGIRFAAILLLMFLRGLFELFRKRERQLLTIFLLWPLYFVTGFVITIFREGHLQFHYYIVFSLAAIGLSASLSNWEDVRERFFLGTGILLLILYGVLDQKTAITYGSSVFFLGLLVAYFTLKRQAGLPHALGYVMLVLFASGLIIRGNFPSLDVRITDAKEQAVIYLVDHLQEGSNVAAGSPGVVYAAKMTYFGLTATDVPYWRSPDEFLDWMLSQDIEAVYVDQTLYNSNPAIWRLIESKIGDGYERGYVANEGNVQILLIDASE